MHTTNRQHSHEDRHEPASHDSARAPGKRTLTSALQRIAAPAASAAARGPTAPSRRSPDELVVEDPFSMHLVGNGPIQRRAEAGAAPDAHDVQAAAARGIEGSGAQLPYFSQIQAAFGAHDISGIRAHIGGAAAEASAEIGARAYATGHHVAFAGYPDLHTAAHEAAHVVQQRAGVSLKGGVGAVGDPYEQHADAVADLVVQGRSAEALLARHAGAATSAAPSSAVQCLVERSDRFTIAAVQDDDLGCLYKLVDHYNSLDDLMTRFAVLDDLEHLLYRWFDARTGYNTPHRLGALDLLDSVGLEHRNLVLEGDALDAPLWVREDSGHKEESLDDSSVDEPAAKEIFEARALYEAIRKGVCSSIAVIERDYYDDHIAGFRGEMLSALARLMSRPIGRTLLLQIAQLTEKMEKALPNKLAPVELRPHLTETGAKAIKGGPNDIPSGSVVQVEPGVPESRYCDFDHDGNELASPGWLGLGHELIHVMRNALGENLANKQTDDEWHNAEELMTIAEGKLTENHLRKEHHLSTPRFGHGTPKGRDDNNYRETHEKNAPKITSKQGKRAKQELKDRDKEERKDKKREEKKRKEEQKKEEKLRKRLEKEREKAEKQKEKDEKKEKKSKKEKNEKKSEKHDEKKPEKLEIKERKSEGKEKKLLDHEEESSD